MASGVQKPTLGKLEISKSAKGLFAIFMFVGLLTFLIGLTVDRERIWHSYLTSFFYFASLGLGGLFFTAIQHVSKAGWSVNVRRVAEAMAVFVPIAFIGAIVLGFGGHALYEWMDSSIVANDHLLQKKAAYLNPGFFYTRLVLFFVIWWLFTKFIVGNSVKQDVSGDEKLTLKNLPLSVAFILIFALSYSLFSVDTLMSLLPHWFSTIFGVYCFSGLFQSSLAMLILLLVWLMDKGLLNGFVGEDHLHDLAKLLKGFTVFYAYIAFSQFMLIWYANIPEETEYYLQRAHGGWYYVSLSLLIFKFIVPFIALLPRWAKRNRDYLKIVCWLILIMQYVDIYWMVYPNFNEHHITFSIWEIGVFLGFLGLFLKIVTAFLSRNNLVPIKDPRIEESLHHHVTY